MQKHRFLISISMVAAQLFFSTIAYAQTSKIKNQIFIGARPLGMGETFVAVADDGNAIYWNPAGLSYIDRYELYSMYTNLFNLGIKNNYISFTMPFSEKLAFGLDWFNIGFGDEELDFSRNTFNFSLGARLWKGLSLGMNIRRLITNASLDGYSEAAATGWGADFGVLLSPGEIVPILNGLKIGIMAHDFTDTRVQYDNGVSDAILPRNIRYGVCYELNKLFFFERPLVALDIDDRIHLGTELWLPSLLNIQLGLRGGLQKDIYPHGEKKFTTSFGTSIKYQIKDRYVLNFDYSYTDSPYLFNSSYFSLGISFSIPASPVKIDTVFVKDIYASFYTYHADTSCGMIKCKYHDTKKLDVRIKLRQPKFNISCEEKVILNPDLQPEDSLKKIDLIPIFSEKILEARGEDKVSANILIEPKTLMRTKPYKSRSNDFTVYGIGKINWANGEDQTAAFITPEDPVVRDLAIEVIKQSQNSPITINETISHACQIFAALGDQGISYVGDINSTYGKKPIDTIYYPRELLARKMGDCDDITVLFASLLESIGIHTALACTRDHIFLILNTDLPEKLKFKFCLDEDMLLIRNHYIWIPIETTLIGEKEKLFWDAWKNATEQLKFKKCNVIDVHEAWKKYRPFPVKALDHIIKSAKVSLPSPSPVSTLLRHHHSIQRNRKKYLEDLENKERQYPDSLQLALKLGNVYAMLDSMDLAETHYKFARSSEPTNFMSYNNLANVYFLKGILDSAEITYQKALAYAPTVNDSDGIYLNLGTLYAMVDSLELACQMYAKVIKSPGDISKVDRLLGISLDKIDLSEIKKLPTEISAVIIKQIVQEALKRTKKAQILKYSDKTHIAYGLKKSKRQIRDVFYWSF